MSGRFIAMCAGGFALTVLALFNKGAIGIAPSVVASANVFYVDNATGSDSNSGSSSAPWKTIQKAANEMSMADTVIVRAGIYNERVQVRSSGVSGAPITYEAEGTVIMQGFAVAA